MIWRHKKLFYDSKTILQEIVQAHFKRRTVLTIWLEEEGPDHNKAFQVELQIGEQVYGIGKGRTKKSSGTGSCLQDHSDAPQKEYKVGDVCI